MSATTTYQNSIESSIRGKWVRIPAIDIGGNTIVVRGRGLKIAGVHDEEWLENELQNPAVCIQELRENLGHGFRADVFTFGQKLPDTKPKYPYHVEMDSIAAIHVANVDEWWNGLPQEGRKNVRRAGKRGVVISVEGFGDKLIEGIMGVNNDSELRQGFRNAHYGKDKEQVRRDHASFLDRSEFICAYVADELIGFIKLVHMNKMSSILNLAVKTSHYDKRPANALIAKAVELSHARGSSYLTYGKYIYGNKRESPLLEFKRRNGFQEVLVPRYYAPLTWKGKVGLKLGLQRGLIGIAPYSLITLGVALRTRWYNFKNH